MARRRPDPAWIPAPGWLRTERDAARDRVAPGFVLLATALAALVRFYHLDAQPLWVDEWMTWDMVRPDAGRRFGEQLLDQIQGPLYLAAIWPLARHGLSEFWLRLPAAIAGVAAVPLLAALAQRLLGGRTARVAAIMLAVSPFHLWYSQEARGYAFVMLFALASSLAFLALASRPDGRRAALYAFLAAGTALSNFSGLFLVAAQAAAVPLWVRPRGGRAWRLWGGALLGALLLISPWLLKASGILALDRLLPGAESGQPLRGATTFTPLALPFTLFVFFFGYSLGPSLAELRGPEVWPALRPHLPLLAAAGGLATGLLAVGASRLGRRNAGLLLLWGIVPLAVVTALALQNVKPFNPRYLAAVFPFVLLVAAHGLVALPRRLGRALGLLLAALFLWSLWGHHADPRYSKEDLRAAAAWVGQRAAPGDAILVPVVTAVYREYYGGDGDIVPFWDLPPIATQGEAQAALAPRLSGRARGWLVLARSWEIDPADHLPSALAAMTAVVDTVRMPGVRVFGWRREDADAR